MIKEKFLSYIFLQIKNFFLKYFRIENMSSLCNLFKQNTKGHQSLKEKGFYFCIMFFCKEIWVKNMLLLAI